MLDPWFLRWFRFICRWVPAAARHLLGASKKWKCFRHLFIFLLSMVDLGGSELYFGGLQILKFSNFELRALRF